MYNRGTLVRFGAVSFLFLLLYASLRGSDQKNNDVLIWEGGGNSVPSVPMGGTVEGIQTPPMPDGPPIARDLAGPSNNPQNIPGGAGILGAIINAGKSSELSAGEKFLIEQERMIKSYPANMPQIGGTNATSQFVGGPQPQSMTPEQSFAHAVGDQARYAHWTQSAPSQASIEQVAFEVTKKAAAANMIAANKAQNFLASLPAPSPAPKAVLPPFNPLILPPAPLPTISEHQRLINQQADSIWESICTKTVTMAVPTPAPTTVMIPQPDNSWWGAIKSFGSGCKQFADDTAEKAGEIIQAAGETAKEHPVITTIIIGGAVTGGLGYGIYKWWYRPTPAMERLKIITDEAVREGFTPGNKMPPKDDGVVMGHIFHTNKPGHDLYTEHGYNSLQELVSDPTSFVGKDIHGKQWFKKLLPDGTEKWAQVSNNVVKSGGTNKPGMDSFFHKDHGLIQTGSVQHKRLLAKQDLKNSIKKSDL